MAGLSFDFAADVSKFIRGTQDVEKALDDVADALDDLAREAQTSGDKAADAIGDGFSDASRKAEDDLEKVADALDETAKESRTAAEKMETTFRDVFDKVKTDANTASKSVGDDVKRGFDRAGEGAQEFKDEANSTAREAAASFDGSADSILDAFQEVAANAFAGFGPAGAAAGLAVAAGIGIGVQMLQQAAEEAEETKQKVIDLASEIAEAGGNLDDVDIAARIREWGQAYADVKSWFEPWQEASITNFERMNALIEAGATTWQDYGRAVSGTDLGAYNRERERLVDLLAAEKNAISELRQEAGESQDFDQRAAIIEEMNARERNVEMIELGITELDSQNKVTEDAIALAGIEQAAIEGTTAALEAQRAERETGRETLTGLIGAENDYYASLEQANEAIEKNGANWDATTAAGRENREEVLQSADAMRDYIQSQIDAGTPMATVRDNLDKQRTELYDLAIQAGATDDEANDLVNTMLGFPDQIDTNFDVTGLDEAQRRINKFITDNDGRRIRVRVDSTGDTEVYTGSGNQVARASGGYVPRTFGGDIDDRINARLSGGEYVLDAQATQQIGPGILDMLNNGQMPGSLGTGLPTSTPRRETPNITVNVNGANMTDEQVGAAVARRLQWEMAGWAH